MRCYHGLRASVAHLPAPHRHRSASAGDRWRSREWFDATDKAGEHSSSGAAREDTRPPGLSVVVGATGRRWGNIAAHWSPCSRSPRRRPGMTASDRRPAPRPHSMTHHHGGVGNEGDRRANGNAVEQQGARRGRWRRCGRAGRCTTRSRATPGTGTRAHAMRPYRRGVVARLSGLSGLPDLPHGAHAMRPDREGRMIRVLACGDRATRTCRRMACALVPAPLTG